MRFLLRLLALALAPDLDQARDQAQTLALPLALARALSLRLLLRLLPRLMVNPSWVVHFHFIFGFSFDFKPSQILQICTWSLELQIWSLLHGICKRNGRIWAKSRNPLPWSVWPP